MDTDDTAVALRDSLAGWLADHLDLSRQGRADLPPAPGPWRVLADELGLLGAGVPESAGGLGGGLPLQLGVVQTLGEWLAAEPYRTSAVLGVAALQGGGEAGAALLPRLLAGEAQLAFAHLEPGARSADDEPGCRWRCDDRGWRLDGHKSGVVAGEQATHLLVSVQRDGEAGLLLVDAAAAGIERRAQRTLDGGSASALHFDAVRDGHWLGGAALLGHLLDLDTLAACAEALGVTQRLLADSTEHLRTRRQFGQPLAAFQVLQHRLADMHIARVQAEALTAAVAAGLDAAAPHERSLAVSSAALATGRACRTIAEGTIQLHGAMGVTEELAAGRWARRALQIELQCTGRLRHLQRLDGLLHAAR